MKTNSNPPIVQWLQSMGYEVSGAPRQAVEALLQREARKWEMSPEQLEAMVQDSYREGVSMRPTSLHVNASRFPVLRSGASA